MPEDRQSEPGFNSRPSSVAREQSPCVTSAAPTAPLSGWSYTFRSLNDRDFRFLWLGLLFMMAGTQMQMMARGYLTYELTSSPFLLGLVGAGFSLPMFALALFGGAIADRVDRKRLIQIGQAMAACIALFVAVAISTGVISWIHLLIASMLQGVMFTFLMPAWQAILPQVVGQENVTNAMALNAAAMSAMTLMAPAVAGLLYATIGPAGVYYLIAGVGSLGIVMTQFMNVRDGGQAEQSGPVIKDIKDGLSYIASSPLVLALLLMGLVTVLLAMPFRFLMPIFVVDVYNRGPEALGLLVSIMGVGSLIGSMFIASIGKWRRGLLLILGSFLTGIGLLIVALIPAYFVAAGIMLFIGLGDAARRTLNQALVLEVADSRYRGRVMSVFMLNFGLMPLGVLPAGIAAEILGGRIAIGILAVLLLITTLFIFVTQKRLRDLA